MKAKSIAATAVGIFSSTLIAGSLNASAAPVQNHQMGQNIRAWEHASAKQGAKTTPGLTDSISGIDVSGYQGSVDWAAQWNAGKRFTWVKATEGTNYINPDFSQQYGGSFDKGFVRGAYHFAHPGETTGAAQANYFLAHGGGWTSDGKTLPGALDLEYPSSGNACWGLSPADMTNWITDFSTTYKNATSKYPILYTSTSWWNQCVSGNFSGTNPLWVARYASSAGALPNGWSQYTVWQNANSPIDQDIFNGSAAQLTTFATNHD